MSRAKENEGGQGSTIDPRKPATRVKAGTLAAALKDVKDAVATRSTVPILEHVLVEFGDGRISLTACDLDIWAVRSLASDDRDGPASADWLAAIRRGVVVVPADALAGILGALDGDAMVTLTAPHGGENRATVAAGRARFRLACLPVEDFPGVPPMEVAHLFEMPCSRMADSLAAVRYAVSSEETRYYLNGIYIHAAQEPGAALTLRMAATDGSRLGRLVQDVPEGAAAWPAMIAARRAVGLLGALLEAGARTGDNSSPSVLVEASGSGLMTRWSMPAADGGEVTVVAKSIDGVFPDYTRVIPSGGEHRPTISRGALSAAIKRVMVLGAKESRCVKCEFTENKLRLSLANVVLGDAEEELACDYAGPGITIGFNGKFWREVLGTLASDEVTMVMADPGAPAALMSPDDADGAISDARLVHVLMPMAV